MTDFSFYNKAYDLIQSIVSEEKSKLMIQAKNIPINDLRLIIDTIKDINPLFANDDESIINLAQEGFKINIDKEDLDKISHIEDDIYRPIEITEIIPGVTIKIIEGNYYYFHKFWCYVDTGNMIPSNRFRSDNERVLEYNRQLMSIWRKSKKGKALIKTTFKHRIDDNVSHIDDPNSRGIIKARRMSSTHKKQYAIFWGYLSNNSKVDFKYWEDEDKLINKTLEALPMKTINKTKHKKCIAVVSIKKLQSKEEYNDYVKETAKKYWYEESEERVIIDKRCNNIEDYIKRRYQQIDNLTVKIIRIEPWNGINSIDPLTTKKIPKEIKYLPRRKSGVSKKLGERKQASRLILTLPVYSGVDNKGRKLVCVKYLAGGVTNLTDKSGTPILTSIVSRIPLSQAKKLVNKENGLYQYCTKAEWRRYQRDIQSAREKLKPGLTTIGIDAKTGIELNRKYRRLEDHQKLRRNSRTVVEQFVPKVIQAEDIKYKSIKPTLTMYDEDNNPSKEFYEKTIHKPARTILKRILTRIPSPKFIKLTPEVKQERLERSKLDKAKYNLKKDRISLDKLKEMFKHEERRNNHFSNNEKWSHSFEILFTLATTGRLVYPERDIDIQLKKYDKIPERTILYWFNHIIKEDHKFKWSDEKIQDFMRYLRLTARGVFITEKEVKVKKTHFLKEFKPIKFITKLDYSKLRYNVPDANKPLVIKFKDDLGELEKDAIYKDGDMWYNDTLLCPLRDVISWRYTDKEEFQDVIVDTGGGIKEIPIKFSWKQPEYLKKFFDRININKLPFIIGKEYSNNTTFVPKIERKKKSIGYINHVTSMYNKWKNKLPL